MLARQGPGKVREHALANGELEGRAGQSGRGEEQKDSHEDGEAGADFGHHGDQGRVGGSGTDEDEQGTNGEAASSGAVLAPGVPGAADTTAGEGTCKADKRRAQRR